MLEVTTKLRDNGTFVFLKDLGFRTDKIGKFELWNLTQKGARFMRESAVLAGIRPFNKVLLSKDGISPRKIGNGRYGIFFPIHGIYLDRMRTHWVALKRGRGITKWAMDRGIRSGAVEVHAHPYITNGYVRLVNNLQLAAMRIADKIVRG